MKKLVSIVLAVALICTALAVTTSAAEKNYFKSEWNKGYCAEAEIRTEGGVSYVSAGPVNNSWISPKVNIIPDLTDALGSDDSVTVKISVEVRVTWEGEFAEAMEGTDVTGRPLIRCESPIKKDTANEETAAAYSARWNAAYKKYCDDNGAEEYIQECKSDGNIFYIIPSDEAKVTFTDGEWTTWESQPFTVSKANLSSEYCSEWNFCFDTLSGDLQTEPCRLEFRKTAIYKVAKQETNSVEFTVVKESTADDSFVKTGAGVITAADVKDGKLTKTFTVKNTGKNAAQFEIGLQTTHEGGWYGPDPATVSLKPGKSATISFSYDVKDNKIEVTAKDKTASYDLSAFFYRVNIRLADGKFGLEDGTKFALLTSEDATIATAFKTTSGSAHYKVVKANVDYASGAQNTGDFAPVAIVAMFVVASLSLVVVSAKKKEN